jgi:hypothetical protein
LKKLVVIGGMIMGDLFTVILMIVGFRVLGPFIISVAVVTM